MEPFNPLTQEHYEQACQGCAECVRLKEYLGKLEKIGLQVENQQKQVDAIHTLLQAIRQEFFPHQT